VLLIGTHDLFGSEMNLASKLGEDVAGRGEILLSAEARARVPNESALSEISVPLSGLTLQAYRCS
jgi:class 3 adenylate cyclase